MIYILPNMLPKPGLLLDPASLCSWHTLDCWGLDETARATSCAFKTHLSPGQNKVKKNYSPTQKPTILQHHTYTPRLPSHDTDYYISYKFIFYNFTKTSAVQKLWLPSFRWMGTARPWPTSLPVLFGDGETVVWRHWSPGNMYIVRLCYHTSARYIINIV